MTTNEPDTRATSAGAARQRSPGGHGAFTFADGPFGPVVELSAVGGTAQVTIQGAQLVSWIPAGQPEVLFMSKTTRPQPGKSLRGGTPVCWPWFGPHPADASGAAPSLAQSFAPRPAHGFVRGAAWRVDATMASENSATVRLVFETGRQYREDWPHEARATLAVTLSATLTLALVTENTGASPFSLTQALHTYFAVGDIAATEVEGLDGCTYIDKVGPDEACRQSGAVTFGGEVDRIYLNPPPRISILDRLVGRRIAIRSEGSASAVVWNPWIEKSARLGDMGPDGYRRMVCVETANAASDARVLAPGESHRLAAVYSVETRAK